MLDQGIRQWWSKGKKKRRGGGYDGEGGICSGAALLLVRPWQWEGFDRRFGGGSIVVQVATLLAGCGLASFLSCPLAF